MYVWTKKAESDYREKWPDKPCKRLAGQEIEYCGSTRVPGSIVAAYVERGWVETAEPPVIETRGWRGRKKNETSKVFEQRWRLLQMWIGKRNEWTVEFLAHSVGFSKGGVLTTFIRQHGEELAQRYGKLPHFRTVQGKELSEAWTRVME